MVSAPARITVPRMPCPQAATALVPAAPQHHLARRCRRLAALPAHPQPLPRSPLIYQSAPRLPPHLQRRTCRAAACQHSQAVHRGPLRRPPAPQFHGSGRRGAARRRLASSGGRESVKEKTQVWDKGTWRVDACFDSRVAGACLAAAGFCVAFLELLPTYSQITRADNPAN